MAIKSYPRASWGNGGHIAIGATSRLVSDDSYEFGGGIALSLGARAKLRLDYTGIRDGKNYKSDRAMAGISYAF